MEELVFGEDCRNKLIEGINDLNRAVASTMGPMGKTVLIPDDDPERFGKYKVTKDGVSVARNVFFKDPIKNIGAQLVKEAAELTVKHAGDGTTTATVLATAFVNNLKDFNSKEINEAFDKLIPKVINELKFNSRELKHEDIAHVATISANNDVQIGNLIQQAYNHSNIVKVEESTNTEDTLITVDGMQFDTSYFSKNFANEKGVCEFQNPNVLLIDGKLDNVEKYEAKIKSAANPETPLVIFTEHIHEQILRKLEAHVLSGNLYLTVIKSPGFGPFRKDLLKDITALGKIKSIKVTPTKTIIVKDESSDISKHIDSLEQYLKSDLPDTEKDLIEKRLENLRGKVSIIRVGGKSELDMKERKDRYDDAVLAVQCALEEGIVSGAGVALRTALLNLAGKFTSPVESAIIDSLYAPYWKIVENGSRQYLEFDLFQFNIIDPLKVTRCALENAATVTKTILSTEATVLDTRLWN